VNCVALGLHALEAQPRYSLTRTASDCRVKKLVGIFSLHYLRGLVLWRQWLFPAELAGSHLNRQTAQLTALDFNDQPTLDLYFQIRSFENDVSRPELLLKDRPRPEQLKIHTIAESFSLEYEYSASTRVVRISRTEFPQAQISVPEATFDVFSEHNPHWNSLPESSSQAFTGIWGFEPFMDSRGVVEDFLKERVAMNQDTLEDLALPLSDLDQITKILPQPENRISVDGTPSNLAQDIDELLPTTESARKRQNETVFQDGGALNLLSWELPKGTVNPFSISTPPYTTTHPRAPSEQEKSRKIAMPQHSPTALGRSESAHSDASDMTGVSVRSGRTGPLSDVARAAMKAVKSVRACWRCMFLRKKVGC
jgi:hypothetical protein